MARRCHNFDRTNQPPGAQPVTTPNYRLVVTASQTKSRQFVWVIVDDSNGGIFVQTSRQTFRSMEAAYDAGQGALGYWRDKMRRTTPSVDLAQPQPQSGEPIECRPQSFLTSRVYSEVEPCGVAGRCGVISQSSPPLAIAFHHLDAAAGVVEFMEDFHASGMATPGQRSQCLMEPRRVRKGCNRHRSSVM
jgi:hypothetical protein